MLIDYNNFQVQVIFGRRWSINQYQHFPKVFSTTKALKFPPLSSINGVNFEFERWVKDLHLLFWVVEAFGNDV